MKNLHEFTEIFDFLIFSMQMLKFLFFWLGLIKSGEKLIVFISRAHIKLLISSETW